MKCKSCGGILRFYNGNYICDNCGLQQTISAIFENTEIFLCYIENDMQGRRSRDSVIAQDLYSKLESAQIHTFYQRISAADLTESDFETVNSIAFDSAKVIVVIATTAEKFQMLIEKYGEKFAEKRVIPVYADMNANDIPKELKHLQAVNYNAVGASVDFVKNVSRILGKEQEVDITATAKKHMSRKKRTVFVSVFVILALMLSAASYVVFGTPYVLKSKKYEYAKQLYETDKYVEAIETFTKLANYKNADGILKNIYDNYDGYYNNEDETISLYINTIDNLRTEIEIRCINEENKMAKCTVSAQIAGEHIEFQFTDDQGNAGSGVVTLTNAGVELSTRIQNLVKDPCIGDMDISFSFENKADAPIKKPITKEDLISWIKQETGKSDLLATGVEIESENTSDSVYRIVNSDIKLLMGDYDFKNDDPSSRPIRLNENIVYAIQAPASILLPEKIGTVAQAFVQGDILFAPYTEIKPLHEALIPLSYQEENKRQPIQKDTPVYIISKSTLGVTHWRYPIETLINSINDINSGSIIDETEIDFWSYQFEPKDDFTIRGFRYYTTVACTLYRTNKSDFQTTVVAQKQYTVVSADNLDLLESQFLQEFYH